MTSYVAIIGNARKISPENEEVFTLMCQTALLVIKNKFQLSMSDVVLVSGGAAWGDHVAVALFIQGMTEGKDAPKGLELYLPCNWFDAEKGFEDSGNTDWKVNPGYLTNTLHRSFSQAIKTRNSLQDLQTAKELGAVFNSSHRGFHNRNTAVAEACQYMIAFTMDAIEPKNSGTADTWNKFKGPNKVHVSIPTLVSKNDQ